VGNIILAVALLPGAIFGQTQKKGPSAETRLIKELEKAGALVGKGVFVKGAISVIFEKDCTDELLATTAKLKNLRELLIEKSPKVTDKGLEALRGHEKLTIFVLRGTKVSKAGATAIASLPSLTSLEVGETTLDVAAVRRLAASPKLTVLALLNTKLEDDDLAGLAGHATLQHLSLRNTPIKGNGLKHLQGIASLKEIDLVGTKASKRQIENLKEAIPGLVVDGKATFLGIFRVKAADLKAKSA